MPPLCMGWDAGLLGGLPGELYGVYVLFIVFIDVSVCVVALLLLCLFVYTFSVYVLL